MNNEVTIYSGNKLKISNPIFFFKYELEGDPIYCPYLYKKITPKDIKLGIISRQQLEISNYCDGKTNVKEIQESLARDGLSITYEEFKNSVNELIKKKFMRMRFCVE